MDEFLLTGEEVHAVVHTLNDHLAIKGYHQEVKFICDEEYAMDTTGERLPMAVYFVGRFVTISLPITDRQAIQMLVLLENSVSKRARELVAKFHHLVDAEPEKET